MSRELFIQLPAILQMTMHRCSRDCMVMEVQSYTDSSLSLFSHKQAEYNEAEHDMIGRLKVCNCILYCFSETNNAIQ